MNFFTHQTFASALRPASVSGGLWLCGMIAFLSVPVLRADPPVKPGDHPGIPEANAETNVPPHLTVERDGRPEVTSATAVQMPADLAPPSDYVRSKRAKHADRMVEWERQLESGRRHRLAKNNALARTTLVPLLEEDAPSEIQRVALIELGMVAEESGEWARAQQIYNQYLKRFPDTVQAPEIVLRQGLVYRQMGVPLLALSKFYGVMTMSMNLKIGQIETYQRLVLQAQMEIAETHFWQGEFAEAADFYQRLLKQAHPDLDQARTQRQLVTCLARLGRHTEAAAQAEDFINRFPQAADQAEVRFLLALSLKQQGRNSEALQHVLQLLALQQTVAGTNAASWSYWQRRAGNEIANHLYNDGDHMNALRLYQSLASLDDAPDWQLPVWYQIGLVYERLQQPQRAGETYQRILDRENTLGAKVSPAVRAVFDMARWRRDFLGWHTRTATAMQTLVATKPTNLTRQP